MRYLLILLPLLMLLTGPALAGEDWKRVNLLYTNNLDMFVDMKSLSFSDTGASVWFKRIYHSQRLISEREVSEYHDHWLVDCSSFRLKAMEMIVYYSGGGHDSHKLDEEWKNPARINTVGDFLYGICSTIGADGFDTTSTKPPNKGYEKNDGGKKRGKDFVF